MKEINNDIKNNTYKPIYLVFGSEIFLLNNIKEKFLNKFKNLLDFNKGIYNDDNYELNELIDKINLNPFLNDKKLIILENLGLFDKNIDENLLSSIKSNADNNIIVILEDRYDIKHIKKNNLYQYIEKFGYISNLSYQSKDILEKYIVKMVKQANKNIDKNTVMYLLEKTGDSLMNITNELEKLLSYTVGKQNIEKDDIDNIVSVTIESDIWDLINAINNRNSKEVIRIYSNLLSLNEKVESILITVRYNYKQLINIKDLVDRKKTINEIKSIVNMKNFAVQKIIHIALSTDFDFLYEQINKISKLFVKYKTGSIDKDIAVLLLIV